MPRPATASASPAWPALYDLAFQSHRDGEVRFLVRCFRRWARRPIRQIVDIACGTGPHLLRLAARGYHVTGLDISPANLAYVAERAGWRAANMALVLQDMADFRLPGRIDAAICMQNAQGYLLTNADIVRHFRGVARALRSGGLYIFDRYLLSGWTHPVRQWTWSRRHGRLAVRASFSVLHDVDPVTQTFDEHLALEVPGGVPSRVYRHRQRSRVVFPQELRALVELAGGLEFVGWFSTFRLDRPLERARAAFMMITVLRRI